MVRRYLTMLIALLVIGGIVYVYADEVPCYESIYLICSPGCTKTELARWNACATHPDYCCQYKYIRIQCTGTPLQGFPACYGGPFDNMYLLGWYRNETCPPGGSICPSHSPP